MAEAEEQRERPVRRTVGIIGAGLAGTAATKIALEHGLEPTCFEQRADLGGIWFVEEELPAQLDIAARVYKGMLQNGVKHFFAFSDFPHKKETPYLLPGDEAKAYLDDYAEEFQLRKHMHFGRKVVRVSRAEDYETSGRWDVVTRAADGGEEEDSQTFDAVIICSGYFSKANWPSVPDTSNFPGTIIHSGQLWDAEKYRDRSVGIVGAGISGGDLASRLAPIARQVYLITRQGTDIIPQFVKPGKSWEELFLNYRLNTSGDIHKIRATWKAAIKKRINTESLNLASEKALFSGSATISHDLDIWVYSGKVKVVRGELGRFVAEGLELAGGQKVEVEDVIFATGYTPSCPFVQDKKIIPDDPFDQYWWQYIYPVEQEHPTLFTVGLNYNYGAAPSTVEIQSRAVCGIINGSLELPPREEMDTRIFQEREAQIAMRGTFPGATNHFTYTMELARFIGCDPKLMDILKISPGLAYRLWSGCLTPFHYRLCGPHKKIDVAKKALEEFRRDRPTRPKSKAKPRKEKEKKPTDAKVTFSEAVAKEEAAASLEKKEAEPEDDGMEEINLQTQVEETPRREAEEQPQGEEEASGRRTVPVIIETPPSANGQAAYDNSVSTADEA